MHTPESYFLDLPENWKRQYPYGPMNRDVEQGRVQEGRMWVDWSQDCFRSTRKVFFKIRVSQQLPEDTTHPKLGVGTKLQKQLISVWLPEPP